MMRGRCLILVIDVIVFTNLYLHLMVGKTTCFKLRCEEIQFDDAYFIAGIETDVE